MAEHVHRSSRAPTAAASTEQCSFGAVLFDLDGTLADSVDLILLSYRHTMEHHLGVTPPDAAWIAGLGRPLRDQLAGFARTPEEAQAMLGTYTSFQETVHDGMVRPCAGVVEVVERLVEAGCPIAVVTSKRRTMAHRTLRCCGLDRHFQIVVTADDVTRGKPHPEAVFAALDALHLAATRRVLLVGDSPHDVRAGNAAGVTTAAVLWGPFEPEVVMRARPHHAVDTPHALSRLLFRGDDGKKG